MSLSSGAVEALELVRAQPTPPRRAVAGLPPHQSRWRIQVAQNLFGSFSSSQLVPFTAAAAPSPLRRRVPAGTPRRLAQSETSARPEPQAVSRPRPADGQDDPAISLYFSTRDQEIAGGVVLLQENDARGHVRVNFGEVRLVGKLDDEHSRSADQSDRFVKGDESDNVFHDRLLSSAALTPRGAKTHISDVIPHP
jgi:hypothetical protein